MSGLTWVDEGGRTLFDCPLCNQAGRVDRHGQRVRLRCYTGCEEDEVIAALDVASLKAELDARQNGAAPTEYEVEDIRRALFEEPQATGDEVPPREEVPGTAGLCHRGSAALFFSERGAGKSTVAVTIGVAAAVAGERVYYFDRENGAALTEQRVEGIIEANDWPDVLADGRFVGRHYPRLSRGWEPEAVGQVFAEGGFTVVIYDSLREGISQLGGDPNSDADISRFVDIAVTPLVARRIAVPVLDNTGHENKHRPKGSGSKLDAIPVAYKVKAAEPFSVVQLGRIEIECTRSRFGDFGRQWTMRVGHGVFNLPEPREESPAARADRERRERREEFRWACAAVLRERSPLGREPLFKAVRERGLSGADRTWRRWLAELTADPASGLVSTDDGVDLPPGRSEAAQGPPGGSEAPLGGGGPHRPLRPGLGAAAPPTPGPGDEFCACEHPARSPRADGWFCHQCKRPGPPDDAGRGAES
jgi:hypothetical protein